MKREPVKRSNTFTCLTCKSNPSIEGRPAMREHLEKVHGITVPKGKKSMEMHATFGTHYAMTYKWDLGTVQFVEYIITPRGN